ncbi:MAG: DMT family transporter [Pseudomonadota bacterium]
MNSNSTHSSGVVFMLAAMLCLPVVDALSKVLSAGYPAEQITFLRNGVHALIVLPFAVRKYGSATIVQNLGLQQCLRSLFFVGMTATYIFALRWMPLADALAITFAFPFVIVALSPWLLGEVAGWRRWSAVAVGFIGACFIIRPGLGEMNTGVPFAVCAALCAAGYVLMTRKLSGSVPSLVMLLMPALIGAAMLVFVMPFVWINLTFEDTLIVLTIGAVAALAHYFIVLSYRYGEASRIAPLTYTQIFFATALGYWMFGDIPDKWTVFGIALIIASAIFIGWRESRLNK